MSLGNSKPILQIQSNTVLLKKKGGELTSDTVLTIDVLQVLSSVRLFATP